MRFSCLPEACSERWLPWAPATNLEKGAPEQFVYDLEAICSRDFDVFDIFPGYPIGTKQAEAASRLPLFL